MTDLKKTTVIHSTETWLKLTQTWIFNQIHTLPSSIEVNIVSKNLENKAYFKKKKVYALENILPFRCFQSISPSATKIIYRYFLAFIIKWKKAKIIHSHFGNEGWANCRANNIAGTKHIVTFYGYDVNRLPQNNPIWVDRYIKLFSTVDLILCEGPYMANSIQKLGCPKSKIKVHHLGIPVESIAFKPRSWNKTEPLRILIVATFNEKKGIPYALGAAALLQQVTNIEITIIGDATNRKESINEKIKILDTINKYNLHSCVRLLGFKSHSEIFEESYQHHIFLSPSIKASDGDTEGGAPVTIIEMAATGMPIVSTTHCDIPEVIENGRTGLLSPEKDVNSLFKNLIWLIDNTEKWENILQEGRKKVENEFSSKVQGKKLADIYTNMVK